MRWTQIIGHIFVQIKIIKSLKISTMFIIQDAHNFFLQKKDAHKFAHPNLIPP